MADTDIVVVGAGVVGLAIAARLAPAHPSLVVLERRDRHGQETSSRNSEVIHAGLYYPTGSLKARLCVAGNRQLYELAARHAIDHRRTGKIITATTREEMPQLEGLLALGRANGVPLEPLSGDDALRLEPNIRSVAALLSPSTGVLSVHALMDCFLHQAKAAGALLQPRTEVIAIERTGAEYRLTLRTPEAQETLSAERVINAAGLESDTIAALAGVDADAAGYRLHYCKGSYFAVAPGKARLVTRLVYPVPTHVSLGVHAVVDVAGGLRFGPDAEYLEGRALDYSVADAKRTAFGAAVRRIVPAIEDDDLRPDLAGIRPKLQGPGETFRDFVIREESDRGLPGFVNLVGIDSPGLTAAPALADFVAELVGSA